MESEVGQSQYFGNSGAESGPSRQTRAGLRRKARATRSRLLSRRISVLLALASLVLGIETVSISSAYAALPACSSVTHAWRGAAWTVNNAENMVGGVEAPVRLRVGADLCDSASDAASSWIGIEPSSNQQITQIGFAKYVSSVSSGATSVCRFWATGGGNIHCYNSSTAGGTTVYFRIKVVASSSAAYYAIQDCGTGGGYGSCTTVNQSQAIYGSGAWSLFASEVSYSCGDTMMGGPTSPVNIGNASYAIKEENAVNGGWSTRPLDNLSTGATCAQYAHTYNDSQVQTWDTRN